MLDKDKMEGIYAIQRDMQNNFRNVPAEGKNIDYLGEKFRVYPGVFWPSWDSQAMVKNYTVNSGESVLDVCSGSGVIAVFSAKKGASKVVALDINPDAIRTIKENSERHGFRNVIDARVSDVFSALGADEKFDVVTMNPPFTPHKAEDYAEKTMWDEDLKLHRAFFSGVDRHLKDNGRIYLAHAKFGAIDEMKSMAKEAGFSVKQIGENKVDEDRVFYAFELRRIA